MNEKPTLVLFDLDGTLTDPGEGITKSIQYALRDYGISKEPEELRFCIGPPLADSFIALGVPAQRAQDAIARYRERYNKVLVIENKLYAGIPELLGALCDAGCRIGLATSKPGPFAVRVLEHFGLLSYFEPDLVVGSEFDGTRGQKWEVVAEVLRRSGVRPDKTVMVGDRRYDVEGAAKCLVRTVGAAWGYGSEEELRDAGAWAVAENPDACRRILLNTADH